MLFTFFFYVCAIFLTLDKACKQVIPTSYITMKNIPASRVFQVECSNKQDKSYSSLNYPFQSDIPLNIRNAVRNCLQTFKYNLPVLDCFCKFYWITITNSMIQLILFVFYAQCKKIYHIVFLYYSCIKSIYKWFLPKWLCRR